MQIEVVLMVVMGVFGWLLEEHSVPVAPLILGLVLGEMLEQNFMTSMIKSDGSFLVFFERPIAGVLGVSTLVIWGFMIRRMLPLGRRGSAVPAGETAPP